MNDENEVPKTTPPRVRPENVLTIVEMYLVYQEYDGLFNSYVDCACKVGDLMPCVGCEGGPRHDCEPGWIEPCPEECCEHEFHIGRTSTSLRKREP